MADITKKSDRNIPPNQRSVRFTDTDSDQGDVLMVKDSLGHSAQHLTIDSQLGMTIRMNVYHTIYPLRETNDGLTQWWPGLPNLALGQTYKDTTNALIEIGSGETFVLDDEVPVDSIELVTISGNFSIIAM